MVMEREIRPVWNGAITTVAVVSIATVATLIWLI